MSIPQYLMGQVGQIDFSPAENALTRMLKQQEMQKNYALQQERMGMDRERLGFERQRLDQEMQMNPLRLGLEQARLAQARDELGFNRERHPLQLDLDRQRLAGTREDLSFRREMRPLEVEAARKKLETDPLMIVPDGASVLNRQTREVTQPAGQSWNKLPEFAAKSAAFASRMVEAERNVRSRLAEVEARRTRGEKGFDPTSPGTAAVNALPEVAANFARDPDHQRYRQAAEQWIRAFLRKESGAAISKDEFARDFIVYFPQPGDSPEVIRQKERARLEAKKGFVEETRNYFAHVNPRGQQQINEWYKAIEQLPATQRDLRDSGSQPAVGPREFISAPVDSRPGIPVAPQQTAPPPLPRERRAYPQPPAPAVEELMRSPSPQMKAFFDEEFGPGSADAVLKGRR